MAKGLHVSSRLEFGCWRLGQFQLGSFGCIHWRALVLLLHTELQH